jgi:hypothetical protein
MKQYTCNRCGTKPCTFIVPKDSEAPEVCPYNAYKPTWVLEEEE